LGVRTTPEAVVAGLSPFVGVVDDEGELEAEGPEAEEVRDEEAEVSGAAGMSLGAARRS
jgi:hypothetical protein